MPAEFGKDELLAQAILDLELKMKHEIRQNNAYLLSKIEKHYEQTDKKLTFLEAKMEALNRDREDRQQHHSRGGRRTNYFATNNFAQNNTGGRVQLFGVDGQRVGRPTEKAFGTVPSNLSNQQQQHPYKVFGVGGSGNTPANRQQFKPNSEKPMGEGHGHGGRYKQTLGSSKPQNQWTTKAAGLYTDEEDSSDGSESESRKSETKHLVVKPHEESEDQLHKVTPVVKPQEESEDQLQKVTPVVKPQEESEDQLQQVTPVVKPQEESEDQLQKVTPVVKPQEELEDQWQKVTPGATISPVLGGFGRRRK